MTREEFVSVIRSVVYQRPIDYTLEDLRSPPKKPHSPRLLEMSRRFNSLSSEDQHMVRMAVENAAHAAVFQFLCVLDGVQAIEASEDKGTLELRFLKNEESHLLAGSPGTEMLHDIFNTELPESLR